MDKSQIDQLRKVISNLKNHPLCATPHTIEFLENKLNDRKYSNYNEFIQDLNDQIDSNYHIDSETSEDIAEHYRNSRECARNIVKKELNKAYLYNADDWSELIIKYNNRYKSALSKLTDTKQEYLSIHDLQNFISATEYLNDEKSVNKMIKIIKSKEPKQNLDKSNIRIDLTRLQKPTILALIDFAKDALAKKNIPYPS